MKTIPYVTRVPPGWQIERLDRLFRQRREEARADDPLVTAYIDGTVTLRANRPGQITKSSGMEHGYQHVEAGDLVISGMNAHLGGLGVADASGKCTPVYIVLEPTGEIDARYISRVLWFSAQCGYVGSLVNAVRYNSSDFRPDTIKSMYVPLPPLQEQRRIADFLDDQTTRIDNIITARQQQVDAVGRILEARVAEDSAAIIPPSNRVQLRRVLAEVRTGSTPAESRPFLGGVPWYTPASISSTAQLGEPQRTIDPDAGRAGGLVPFSRDSVLLVGIGATAGRVAYLDLPASGNQQLTALRTNYLMEPRFLFHQLRSRRAELLESATFTTLPILNNETVRSFAVGVPARAIQSDLVQEWEAVALTVDQVIGAIGASIVRMHEFKRSLITAAVSGEFDVSSASGRVAG